MNSDASKDERIYDVSLSFLVQSSSFAQALYDKLSEELRVFFFPHNQEELAGTDGQESMRKPFLRESRLNVVLYRESWGHTPWTRVEASAIKDACLEQGWESLFFFMVDPAAVPPVWLPKTHIRFNYGDFTLEQAVGAIKARVRERGGVFQPMTPLRQAELYRAEEDYRADKALLQSPQEFPAIQVEVKKLFTAVEEHCRAIREQGHLDIRCEWTCDARGNASGCIVTTDEIGMTLNWQPYTGSLSRNVLVVEEYPRRLILASEMKDGRWYFEPPKPIATRRYLPDLSRAREHGWSEKGRQPGGFLSSSTLAEACVIQVVKSVGEKAEERTKRNPDSW